MPVDMATSYVVESVEPSSRDDLPSYEMPPTYAETAEDSSTVDHNKKQVGRTVSEWSVLLQRSQKAQRSFLSGVQLSTTFAQPD